MDETEYLIEGTPYRLVESRGIRSLRYRGDDSMAVTNMRLATPNAMIDATTIVMTRLLVFHPGPHDILKIGLGGGVQAKYILDRLPDARLVCVEIDPAMVRIAQLYFGVPAGHKQLSIVVSDGADYVRDRADSVDMIICDAEEKSHVPAALSTEEFYRNCHNALRKGGMMAMSFECDGNDDAWREPQVKLLKSIFGTVVLYPTETDQTIALLFKEPLRFDPVELAERAQRLEPHLQLGLPEFVRKFAELQGERKLRLRTA